MRVKFLCLLLALAVLVVLGELISYDPGYLLLSYGVHVVETSLVIAVFFLCFGLQKR